MSGSDGVRRAMAACELGVHRDAHQAVTYFETSSLTTAVLAPSQ
jgi:hypothetical protein